MLLESETEDKGEMGMLKTKILKVQLLTASHSLARSPALTHLGFPVMVSTWSRAGTASKRCENAEYRSAANFRSEITREDAESRLGQGPEAGIAEVDSEIEVDLEAEG